MSKLETSIDHGAWPMMVTTLHALTHKYSRFALSIFSTLLYFVHVPSPMSEHWVTEHWHVCHHACTLHQGRHLPCDGPHSGRAQPSIYNLIFLISSYLHYLWLESWSWPSPDRRPVAASSLMIYEIGFIP